MKRGHGRTGKGAAASRRDVPHRNPDPAQGLSAEQVRLLTEAGWKNDPVESPTKSDGQIVSENVFTYFNLIFVVLATLLFLVRDGKDAIFLPIIIINSIIGIVQQIRSKRTIDRLTLLSASKLRVIREGAVAEVPADQLVREDIVELSAGSQIPADGPVLQGQVLVNEALITGEADPIPKGPGDALLSGSFVVSGTCRARMDQVGADSYASRLTLAAKKHAGPVKSEMMQSLDRLIRVIGVILLPMGAALFCNQYFLQDLGLRRSVVSTVAALVGMIPEGLFLLTSVALAVSVIRLAQNRTLIHEMNAIETLARVDVLCVDKTGTVTSPQMTVRAVIPLHDGEDAAIADVIGAFFQVLQPDNDTARALAKRFPRDPGWTAGTAIPFSPVTKWSAVNFPHRGAYVIGAPEHVLEQKSPALEQQIRSFAEQGGRVLVLAHCQGAEEGTLHGPIRPMGLLVLENPIRPSAPQVFRYFRDQGVRIKVISGDHPVTVSAVAAQAGIQGAEHGVDARELTTDAAIERAVRENTVFGRVVPEQKRQIIRALQRQGHTVAMTGDGVNDVLALKDADCGIAMASGADAACQVAQLVLLDSDFAALPKVVAEGRRVINNIQRASTLYLVKNIVSFFLALIALFVAFPFPFVPIQLTLVASLTIGIPSFFLAMEANCERVNGRFLQNVFRRAFPGGLTAVSVLLLAECFAAGFGLPMEEVSTICVLLMALNGLTVIYYAARPLSGKRALLLGSMTAGLLIAVLWFPKFFNLCELSVSASFILMGLSLLVVPLQTALKRLFDHCACWVQNYRAQDRKQGRIRAFLQSLRK